jgi:putative aminopeptidase FrvX
VHAYAQSVDSLVLRLSAMSAVSGFEEAMAESLLAALPGSELDPAGNVLWTRGSGDPRRIALCPMDEVGYVVSGVTPEGYLTLRRVGSTPVGPLYDQFLEGQRVTVFGRRGAVPGVVGVQSTHLRRGRDPQADPPFSLEAAYVDVGTATAAQAAELGIGVLSPVTRAKRVHRYGADLVAAPGVSDRAACAALLAAALRLPAHEGTGSSVVAFTRRRHFGQAGASFLLAERARGVSAVDVVLLGAWASDDSLGAGWVLVGRDTLAVADALQEVTTWALPARYPRSPVETISLRDAAVLAERLSRFLAGER